MMDNALYRPSTFEERGTAIPFTTAMLAQTRVRMDDRDQLVLVMPSLGGGMGSYVMPWKGVPDIVTMTVHDRMLHEEIRDSQACSPEEMRRSALKVAATGLAGPEAAAASVEAIRIDEEDALTTHFMLVLSLFTALGISRRELMEVGRDGTRWRAVAKRTLAGAAGDLDLAPEALYARIQELSTTMTGPGLAQSISGPSRLRRLLAQLIDMRHSMTTWAEGDRSDAADLGRVAAETATMTIALAEKTIEEMDRLVGDINGLLRDWTKAFPLVRRAALRLSWLLDGWDFIVGLWDQSRSSSAQERRDAMIQIFRILPLVPAKEIEWSGMKDGERREDIQRRRVKPMQDWRTGKYDLELVSRIEAVKTRALRPPPPEAVEEDPSATTIEQQVLEVLSAEAAR